METQLVFVTGASTFQYNLPLRQYYHHSEYVSDVNQANDVERRVKIHQMAEGLFTSYCNSLATVLGYSGDSSLLPNRGIIYLIYLM